jgi:hypothetical protein
LDPEPVLGGPPMHGRVVTLLLFIIYVSFEVIPWNLMSDGNLRKLAFCLTM